MASLLSLARKAGRAHGSFLADQEEQKQARLQQLDDFTRERWNFDKSLRQQKFDMEYDNNQLRNQWGAAQQQRLALDHANKLADRARMIQWATADRANQLADRTHLINTRNYLFRQKQLLDQRNNDWANRKLQAFNRLPQAQQDSYILAGKISGIANTAEKPGSAFRGVISDSRIENMAKSISPSLARHLLENKFEMADSTFKNLGKTKDEFISDLSDAYAYHVRSQGKNAQSFQDFAYRYGKNHSLQSVYNMTPYLQARGRDAQEKKQTGFMNWLRNKATSLGLRDTHEEDYSEINPRNYRKQQHLLKSVLTATGDMSGDLLPAQIRPETMRLLQNEEFLRQFDRAQRSGMDLKKIIAYYMNQQTGGKK